MTVGCRSMLISWTSTTTCKRICTRWQIDLSIQAANCFLLWFKLHKLGGSFRSSRFDCTGRLMVAYLLHQPARMVAPNVKPVSKLFGSNYWKVFLTESCFIETTSVEERTLLEVDVPQRTNQRPCACTTGSGQMTFYFKSSCRKAAPKLNIFHRQMCNALQCSHNRWKASYASKKCLKRLCLPHH